MTEKYVLEVDIDHETGEEHCTVLKTDGTTNMTNWIEIVSAMYTHHSILEPLVDELNKNYNGYSNTEKHAIKLWNENEHLKKENKELRQDNDIKFWKLQCIQSMNNNQVMLFELSRAIQQGYEVSDKFKQYMEEIKEHDKEIREKHKRLFE